MREIAARVGVSEPAIYRHYESKEAILADIVATAGDRISGEMRKGLAHIEGADIESTLHRLIEMRRRGLSGKRAAKAAAEQAAAGDGGAAAQEMAIRSGAGGVMHILFHAAPHNEMFIGLLRSHLGQPMVAAVREAVPRVDAHFGIERTPEEVDSHVRVFMSLFAGYFTTTLLFDTPPNDDAIVEALIAIMGWVEPSTE